MRTYYYKSPWWMQRLYPGFVWKKATKKSEIYLTFDDGPEPDSTPWVLEQLAKYGAKATFFVTGCNADRYEDILIDVINAGHTIGNHSYSHGSGWFTQDQAYFQDIFRCQTLIDTYLGSSSKPLFRPPYGRITKSQSRHLQEHFEMVMWSILSGDFDPDVNVSRSLGKLKSATPGSILLFHDSRRHWPQLKKLLPHVLKDFSDRGYSFSAM
ncbi:MAG: polysaccharide deacetylase family protein [Cyclobacteriaceae bacterium]|nr:polysaccharide deacetylase family protein [Cyclobacteriaceae bacterium HetDA_MAG_MS6]